MDHFEESIFPTEIIHQRIRTHFYFSYLKMSFFTFSLLEPCIKVMRNYEFLEMPLSGTRELEESRVVFLYCDEIPQQGMLTQSCKKALSFMPIGT